MDIIEAYEYCYSKNGCSEHQPFGDDIIVFKIGPEGKKKCFALLCYDTRYLLLKCDPELALELRERYEWIEPGFHMNKKHWNGVKLDGDITDDIIRDMIDHSYSLVCASLPAGRRVRVALPDSN